MVSERVALLLLIFWSLSWSLTPVVMDFLKILMFIYQLAYFVYLSLVASIKSFLVLLGLVICDDNYFCYIALTALKAYDFCLWYLDSGCSKHMTGNKRLFKTPFEGKIGTVTFGDGSKSVIGGIGTVDIPGLPVFEDVWYVDGLKANLPSISQICDNGLNVLFTKYECEILDGRWMWDTKCFLYIIWLFDCVNLDLINLTK